MNYHLFSKALEKGAQKKRLNEAESFSLIESIDPDTLMELGQAALENRKARFGNLASYVFNMHINPSNICIAGCKFCKYAALPDSAHAYVLSEDEIFAKVEHLNPTEVHIVGGLNKIWDYRRNLDFVRHLRQRYPDLYIKSYTAVEIDYFARTTGKSEKEILSELIDAGMNGMPGGGAEIFSDRLFEQFWKNKARPEVWLRIHKQAHQLDIKTNATMLFGFGETLKERITHLLTLRKAQDESHGFACFIPLAFQPGEELMIKQGPTPLETLAVIAISRLILDNIDHIKSYWPMIGIETAGAGLSWGGDDMDGTLSEEKVAHLAGARTPVGLARQQMQETIRMSGFTPVERDGWFNLKKQENEQ